MYRSVPSSVRLPEVDHGVLAFWRDGKIFDRSIEQSAGGPEWTFYEGPPTANGMPGTHHVEARAFKDVFPRFKTMRGFHVDRRAGWDCHGLPVELAVERELGFNGKPDIEAYGVEAFNAKCRESVLRHVDAFSEMTERMGYWTNFDQAYWTMSPEYVESVWWALKQIHSAGLLAEDYRVSPYCPRCGTGLSDHELAQGYETITDPSVYVRFPLVSGPWADRADLLVWTTTPWTLVSNALVAIKADQTYVVAQRGQDHLVVAEPLLDSVLGDGWTVLDRYQGTDLVGWAYQRPFELVDWPTSPAPAEGPSAHFVVAEDYVTIDEGTGLVHQAPAFGADDFASCRRNQVAMVNPIDAQGRFAAELELIGGDFFRDANPTLIADLEKRGLMFRALEFEHSYPHCWRCHTTLIYYALPSWYIRTTKIKDRLLAENEATNWYPDSIKHGRYGDWLNNNIDWALSRSRYWGTPLPIWRCPAGHETAIGSRAELSQLSGSDQSALDPHRPYVDDVMITCERCGEQAQRVPEVIDAWFDSGSMPFAQWGFPHQPGSQEIFDASYPAQYICEAIDQTRGWFYSLMAVGTAVFDKSSYENVVCLGHILAEDGRKMSKHLGNVLEPIPLMEEHGADAVRWFMLASGSPWAQRRVGHTVLQEIVRKVLLTYWNSVSFHALYARTAEWTPATGAPDVGQRHVLDRWLTAETHRLTREVTAALDNFDTQRAGQLLSSFVDALSNWYVRRSRRRFWSGDPGALATMHDTLDVLTRLLAPMTPFITEQVWQDVIRPVTPDAPDSVHLSTWPTWDEAAIDDDLATQVQVARRVVELGRAARSEAGVRTRQPLRRALIGSAAYALLGDELRADIAEELNVGTIESLAAAGGDLVDYSAKGNFRALGKRFAKQTPVIAAAIAAADPAALAEQLKTGTATVQVDGDTIQVSPEEVIISERPREGWSVVNEQGETIALDLELTPELVRAGLAREAVRQIQEARKSSGLEVTDRITLWWRADGELADALTEHGATVADEVLATSMINNEPDSPQHPITDTDLGLTIWLTKA